MACRILNVNSVFDCVCCVMTLPGRSAYSNTPAEYGYTNLWMTEHQREYVLFGVEMCNSAHIALSEYFGESSDVTKVHEHCFTCKEP